MRKILMIYTGGTIGMVRDLSTGLLKPLDFSHLLNQIPELHQFDLIIDTRTFEPVIDSSEIQPSLWQSLAEMIMKEYHNYDGFVILHGTDTMAYTASALSFMLPGLSKPVILTGSQLPIGTLRTDGKENLISSLEIAAATDKEGHPIVPEVSVYFEYKLFRGNRTTKYSAETFNAFQSPNYPLLAETGVHIHYNHAAILKYDPQRSPRLRRKLNTNIIFLKVFPGLPDYLTALICDQPDLEGIILETYGAGNGPTRRAFLDPLRKFIERGGIILNVSQCSAGMVDMEQYETGKKLQEAGVIGGRDLTKEAALTKMMLALSMDTSPEEKKMFLQTPICGEMHS